MKQKLLILIYLLAIAFIVILSIIFIQNSGISTIKNDEDNSIINLANEENIIKHLQK